MKVLNNSVLNSITYNEEMAGIAYDICPRFVPILQDGGKSFMESRIGMGAEIAMDNELRFLYNGTFHMRMLPMKRNFEDYSIEVQSKFLLCMRITNLIKLLYIFKKEKVEVPERIHSALKHILSVLQDEFKDADGGDEYHHGMYKDKFRILYGEYVNFEEFLIFSDLVSYHREETLSNVFVQMHKDEFMLAMSVIYLSVEVHFLSLDIPNI